MTFANKTSMVNTSKEDARMTTLVESLGSLDYYLLLRLIFMSGHQDSLSTKSESSQVPLERPLTPLSRCLQVGLPAQTIQTAAAAFNTKSHGCDEHMGNIAFIHAKVYCFAHQFLISGLEDSALQRLTQHANQFILRAPRRCHPPYLRFNTSIKIE